MIIDEHVPNSAGEIRHISVEHDERLVEMIGLYEQDGKPFEADHRGEYIAISRDGRTLLGTTLYETGEQSTEVFGPGSFVFKVGERSAGTIR